MTPAEPFSLVYPPEARRAFGSEESLRRMAKVARFANGARVLHFGCGGGGAAVVLARELGCTVTALDTDEKAVEALRQRVKTHSLADRISIKVSDLRKPALPEGEFDGIVADGRLPGTLNGSVSALRRFLAPKGRLCLTFPVRVGRQPLPAAVSFWEKKLGEPLPSPRDALVCLEKAGYEPQTIETLPNPELDDFYRSVEAQLGQLSEAEQATLQEELATHRSQGGRASVTFALMIGRRKEPGEKPPPSRSDG